MAHANEDLRRPVIYSSDSYVMRLIPLALLLSFAGLALVSSTGSVNGAGFAFMAFLFLLAFGTLTAFTLLWFERVINTIYVRSTVAATLLSATLCLAIFSPCFFDSDSKACKRAWRPARLSSNIDGFDWIEKFVDPIEVMGWVLFFFGLLWIAVTFLMRILPMRLVLRLTPDGISYNRPGWLKLQIPWREIRDVGAPVYSNDAGCCDTVEPWVAVSVSRAFFEQHVPKSSAMFFWTGARAVVEPKSDMIQVILNSKYLAVDPKDIREPIEVRRMAFGSTEAAPHQSAVDTGPEIVFGCWTLDGSLWQTMQFLVPIIGVIALSLHVGGLLLF